MLTLTPQIPKDPESESNKFEVLWQWPGAPVVRGYPHVEFKAKMLPLKLSSLSSLIFDASWEMALSSLEAGASHDPTAEPNASGLKQGNVEANVCIDIFADPKKKQSTASAKQMYEIMIWFGQFGSGTLPVGNRYPLNPPVVTVIQDTELYASLLQCEADVSLTFPSTLSTGNNSNGQIVHSWIANKTLTAFDMDFAPLLYFLSDQGMVPADVYLGTVQFGTETFAASSEVNFTVTSFEASMNSTNGKSEGSATVGGALAGPGTGGGRPSSMGVRTLSVFSGGKAVILVSVLLVVMLAS